MAEYIILDEFLSEETKESAAAQGYLHKLVRCKNCKLRKTIYCLINEQGFGTDDDWFCADGEPKGGEQE